MSSQSACSASRTYFAGLQQNLIVALCGVAFAALVPQGSSAQQAIYYDFNTPNATPGQTSTSCTANSAASGVLLCSSSMARALPAHGTTRSAKHSLPKDQ